MSDKVSEVTLVMNYTKCSLNHWYLEHHYWIVDYVGEASYMFTLKYDFYGWGEEVYWRFIHSIPYRPLLTLHVKCFQKFVQLRSPWTT